MSEKSASDQLVEKLSTMGDVADALVALLMIEHVAFGALTLAKSEETAEMFMTTMHGNIKTLGRIIERKHAIEALEGVE